MSPGKQAPRRPRATRKNILGSPDTRRGECVTSYFAFCLNTGGRVTTPACSPKICFFACKKKRYFRNIPMGRDLEKKIWMYTTGIMIIGLIALYSASFENLRVSRQVFYDQLGCADRKSTRLNSSHSQISYAAFFF